MAHWSLLVICLLMMSLHCVTARPDILGGLLGGLLGGDGKQECMKEGGRFFRFEQTYGKRLSGAEYRKMEEKRKTVV
ncbi:hypothetical protein J6590_094477 [Homalodisca vitripennis]|nr:hypothetical protein J6590_094477 [Homalodisca vitripennis]